MNQKEINEYEIVKRLVEDHIVSRPDGSKYTSKTDN
jgi:hypothetical protein